MRGADRGFCEGSVERSGNNLYDFSLQYQSTVWGGERGSIHKLLEQKTTVSKSASGCQQNYHDMELPPIYKKKTNTPSHILAEYYKWKQFSLRVNRGIHFVLSHFLIVTKLF